MPTRVLSLLVAASVVCAAEACRSAGGDSTPRIVQPGAPGQPGRVITAETATDLSHVQPTAADVRFMQGMISHHAQAIEMVELLKTRTASDDMRKLAQRIEISQRDEIDMMQRWLRAHGQEVPDPQMHHSMHGMAMPLMPGMLSEEEMRQLAAASGPAFDRLFLEGMIKHHGGALTMVQELFATAGAAQDSDIFAFASDVDADQRAEIDRMAFMLKELQK